MDAADGAGGGGEAVVEGPEGGAEGVGYAGGAGIVKGVRFAEDEWYAGGGRGGGEERVAGELLGEGRDGVGVI